MPNAGTLLHVEARRAEGLSQVFRALSQPETCALSRSPTPCLSRLRLDDKEIAHSHRGVPESVMFCYALLCMYPARHLTAHCLMHSDEEPEELVEVNRIQQTVQVRKLSSSSTVSWFQSIMVPSVCPVPRTHQITCACCRWLSGCSSTVYCQSGTAGSTHRSGPGDLA